LEEDAAALGVELAPEVIERQRPDDFAVLEENWEILMFFLRVSTQWRVSMAGPTGLDHGVTLSLLSLYAVEQEKRVEIFEGVRIMEDAALDAMARRAAK